MPTNNTWHLGNASKIDYPRWKVQQECGGCRMGWCCASECVYAQTFKFVCGFGGNSAKNREARFQGLRGSHCSRVRKLCFSLHQPICPHICSASQTPVCFLELLCQSVIQTFTVSLLESRYVCERVWLCVIKRHDNSVDQGQIYRMSRMWKLHLLQKDFPAKSVIIISFLVILC